MLIKITKISFQNTNLLFPNNSLLFPNTNLLFLNTWLLLSPTFSRFYLEYSEKVSISFYFNSPSKCWRILLFRCLDV